MNNFNSILDDKLDFVHIINESNLNYIDSNVDFDFEQKN